MLKTKNRSTPKKSSSRAKPSSKKKPAKLTSEQQARVVAFEKFVKNQQEAWNALTPAQQREEHEGWKRAMNQMNEDRRRSGQRLLFLEPIE
jgi:hypothetical protein